MNHAPTFFVLLPLVAAVGIFLGWRHLANAKALLQEWAQANHFRILHSRRCIFMPWRLYFTTTRYQIVYQVSLYDESTHRVRAAWVRLGTRVWGVMDGDAVDVTWDDAGGAASHRETSH